MVDPRHQHGQASIETAALLPALLLAALVCWQAVLTGWGAVSAAHAARAAARAEMVGEPPLPAATAAVPSSMRAGLTVRDGDGDGRVSVTLHVPSVVPGLDITLSGDADVVRQ
jgi:TadE-like protein